MACIGDGRLGLPLRGIVLAALLGLWGSSAALAGTTVTPAPLNSGKKAIETAGVGVAIALPLLAGSVALYKDDWTGVAQLTVDTLATVGTAYALKNIVRERRPDGSDYQSFPSDTTALAASGSSFLWARYGWEWGLPAFAATQFVSYSRIQAKKHHWYDTAASSVIGIGYASIFTTRFRERYHVSSDIEASPDGASLHVSYDF
jgi:membrane-associated phospholipid phosphatase